jgi:hypothetical protein
MEWMDAAITDQLNAFKDLPEYKFYDGTISVYYDDDKHEYIRHPKFDEGIEPITIDGVTTVVHIIDKSPALSPWVAKMTKECALSKLEAGRTYTQEELVSLIGDAALHYKEYTEQAANIGKMAHNCLEQTIKKAIRDNNGVVEDLVEAPEHPQALSCCIAALDWMRKHNVRWLFTERKIYSRDWDYAGTLDGVALVDSCGDIDCCHRVEELIDVENAQVTYQRFALEFKDRLSLTDWKSSNYLYDEYRFQTAAYEHAHEEEFGVNIEDRWVLRLGKDDGKFEPWHIGNEDFELDFQTYLDCLALHRHVRTVRERGQERRASLRAAKKAERDAAKAVAKAAEKEAKAQAKAEAKAHKLAEKEAAKAAKKKPKVGEVIPANINGEEGTAVFLTQEVIDQFAEAGAFTQEDEKDDNSQQE